MNIYIPISTQSKLDGEKWQKAPKIGKFPYELVWKCTRQPGFAKENDPRILTDLIDTNPESIKYREDRYSLLSGRKGTCMRK